MQLYEPNPENIIEWSGIGAYNRLHDDIFEFAYVAFTENAYAELNAFSTSLENKGTVTHTITLLKKFSEMVSRERTA
jgi:hypothetical protein